MERWYEPRRRGRLIVLNALNCLTRTSVIYPAFSTGSTYAYMSDRCTRKCIPLRSFNADRDWNRKHWHYNIAERGQTTTGRGKSVELPAKGETSEKRRCLLAPKYSIVRVKCLCCWPVRNECIPGMRSDSFEWICSKLGVRTYQRLTETLGFPAVSRFK
jgi:hypothetical protein